MSQQKSAPTCDFFLLLILNGATDKPSNVIFLLFNKIVNDLNVTKINVSVNGTQIVRFCDALCFTRYLMKKGQDSTSPQTLKKLSLCFSIHFISISTRKTILPDSLVEIITPN